MTRKWSVSPTSSLSTSGLALRQVIQKLEYSSTSTGFPDVSALLKSSGLETVLAFVLAINWKATRDANVTATVAVAHVGLKTRQVNSAMIRRISNPRATKE